MSVIIRIIFWVLTMGLSSIFIKYREKSRLEKEKSEKLRAEQQREKLEAIENKRKREEMAAKEAQRIASYQKKLNESYFLEQDGGETPYSMEEIKNLMKTGDLKLNSKIKYGYETDDYKPVLSFEELNQDFKDFL